MGKVKSSVETKINYLADTAPLPRRVIDIDAVPIPQGIQRGNWVQIVSGKYKGRLGVVDPFVFQKTVDHPDEYALGYHVVLEDKAVTVNRTR